MANYKKTSKAVAFLAEELAKSGCSARKMRSCGLYEETRKRV